MRKRADRRKQELRPPGPFKLREAIFAQPLHSFQVREPTLGILCLVARSSEIRNELAQVKHSRRPRSNLSSGLFEVGFRCAHLDDIGFVSKKGSDMADLLALNNHRPSRLRVEPPQS